MFETFKANRKSIAETVADHIKDLIHQGKFQAGDKILGERDMSQRLHVSRNTVREAYKILAAQGYLTIKHGNGVYISDAETQLQHITSSFFIKYDHVLELFAIRKVLETQAVKWAVERLDQQQESDLNQLLADTLLALEQETAHDQLAELDQTFHLSLARMSGNSILLRIMMNLIDLLEQTREETIRIRGRATQSLKEHINILHAILERDAEKAEQCMLEHLSSVEQSILRNKQNGGSVR
ncbi:FadR family transcriptional regulator [Brevibacillus humidisoli]|uniref:FadR/GntR family transcriptional regulator n=1 Tax=Brevibacillus humidisoli TaxID=2895522 RepID=UPI001E3C9F88|nr:FadR/GntR family transcriptional regulator [Brevibacillus humidisoli]UFJ38925.1 FadR family transcriptional regulator [Brevibacillus humidisoli]